MNTSWPKTVAVEGVLGEPASWPPKEVVLTPDGGQRLVYLPADELAALRLTISNAEEALRTAGIQDFGTLAEGVRLLAAREPVPCGEPIETEPAP